MVFKNFHSPPSFISCYEISFEILTPTIKFTDITLAIRKGNLLVPTSYTSGNGDLHVQLHTTQLIENQKPLQDLRLQVTRLDDTTRTTIAIVDVLPDPRLNVTQISIPCQNLLYGGQYELEIVGNEIHTSIDNQDERLRQQLDVRWPMPKLSVTPESIGTYPQNPVDVILEFPGVECTIGETDVKNVPEFWLELYYCGHNVYCDSTNVTSSQVLYAEQVRGYPRARLVKLRCELFGLAGHYIVKLRPTQPVLPIVSATAYIKVCTKATSHYRVLNKFPKYSRLTGVNSSSSMCMLEVYHHAILTRVSESYLNIRLAYWIELIEFDCLQN